MRAELKTIDPDLPVFNVATLDELLSGSIALRRFTMWLLSAFAVTALLLAAVGIYGVFAHSVSQRVREFGVRMALGARPRELQRLVLRQGLALSAFGIAAGVVASVWLGRFVDTLLFGVSAVDPPTFAAMALAVAALSAMFGEFEGSTSMTRLSVSTRKPPT